MTVGAAEADELFRGLLESAPEAMVIVDASGIMRLVIVQTEQLFGYPSGELLGRFIEMLVPIRFRARHRPPHHSGREHASGASQCTG